MNSRASHHRWLIATFSSFIMGVTVGVLLMVSFYNRRTIPQAARPTPAPSHVATPFGKPILRDPITVYLSNASPAYLGSGAEDVIVVVREKITRPIAIK